MNLKDIDWHRIQQELTKSGVALIPNTLDTATTDSLKLCFSNASVFRKSIAMNRYGFGEGHYQYFAYPLPDSVQQIRKSLYAKLAPLANDWMEKLQLPHTYPPELEQFLAQCK